MGRITYLPEINQKSIDQNNKYMMEHLFQMKILMFSGLLLIVCVIVTILFLFTILEIQ